MKLDMSKFHIINAPEPDLSTVYDDKRFITDPLEYWGKADRKHLIDACGWVGLWVQQWLNRDTSTPTSLKSYLESQYKIPLHRTDSASINLKGVFISTYDEDPDEFPYLMVDVNALRSFYMYHNAYVAIPNGQTHFITHMD